MSGECEKCGEHCLDCICHQDIDNYECPDPIRSRKPKLTISETVNHPSHYQGNSLEVIDIIEDFGLNFNLGNAIKYVLRAGKKDSRQEDLNKAIWYLRREINSGK